MLPFEFTCLIVAGGIVIVPGETPDAVIFEPPPLLFGVRTPLPFVASSRSVMDPPGLKEDYFL